MEAPDQDILNYVHGYKAGYIDYKEFNLFARIAHNQNIHIMMLKILSKLFILQVTNLGIILTAIMILNNYGGITL